MCFELFHFHRRNNSDKLDRNVDSKCSVLLILKYMTSGQASGVFCQLFFTAYTPKIFSRKDASAIYTLSSWLCRVTKLGRKFFPRGRRVKCWSEILSLNIQCSVPENSNPDLLLGNFKLKIRIPTDTQCFAQFVKL
jgi:hypothetical protein